MSDPVPLYFDNQSFRFVLKDGTPISNLQLTNVEFSAESTPVYSVGSSGPVGHITGPTHYAISGVFFPEDDILTPEVIDQAEVDRKTNELKARFGK